MPLDCFGVSALCQELNEALCDSRIDKVHMPAQDEVHILGRGIHGSYRLLFSAGTRHPRVHLSTVTRENPATPPVFCMLLRKHLVGGRFITVEQPKGERVLRFIWDCADELGVISQKKLICEMMGRHSNIILAGEDGRIIDCYRKVDSEMSPVRPVLPGLYYRDPPKQEKPSPFDLTESEIVALSSDNQTAEWLMDTFSGLPPYLCRDLESSKMPIVKALCLQLNRVAAGNFEPVIWQGENGTDFSCIPLLTVEPPDGYRIWEHSFSELLDTVYTMQDEHDALKQRASALTKNAQNQRDKLARKLLLLEKERAEAANREPTREKADVLMANLHSIERGAKEVTLEDFYHEMLPIKITLDPSRSAQANAARLYKQYTKAKTAESILGTQLESARTELDYWESVTEQLARVDSQKALQEIKDELHPPRGVKGKEPKLSKPAEFRSSTGIRFWAGRNNRQNDMLTFKMSSRNDLWLHAQKIPGCHVIIDEPDPDEQTILEAATVAAWFSKARTSPKVSIDYTKVKYVKKPPGARPGMVIYDKFQTIYVEPNEKIIKNLMV